MISTRLQGVQRRMVLVVNFIEFFEMNFVGAFVVVSDLVYDVEAIHGLR